MTADEELVRAVRAGRRDVFGVLAERYARRVAAVCWAGLGPGEFRAAELEDVVQESFLRALRAISRLEDPARFGAWLLEIARNASRDFRRARSRASRTTSLETTVDEELAEPSLVHHDPDPAALEDLDRVRREVLALPEHYRETVALFYFGDRSYRAIAELQGVSEATVNQRLTRARARLRERMRRNEEGQR